MKLVLNYPKPEKYRKKSYMNTDTKLLHKVLCSLTKRIHSRDTQLWQDFKNQSGWRAGVGGPNNIYIHK
jgi:hypothetical protein